MDKIDNMILQILFLNSRATNRDIAEVIDLSVSAIHKRIKLLEEDNIITKYIARPSIMALNSIPLVVIGRSQEVSIDEVSEKLGNHEAVFGIAVASGKYMYISVMLRNISELQQVTSYITSTANLSDPIIGIVTEDYSNQPLQLTDYEMKIIKSLNHNARKSLNDVADEIGSSVKTVRKHLNTMIELQKVNFTIEWAPLYRDSFISIFHIKTPPGTDINQEVRNLYDKYHENIVICVGFANVPDFILLEIWTQSPRESHEILEILQAEYLDVVPHILMSISWYGNWIDDMLKTVT